MNVNNNYNNINNNIYYIQKNPSLQSAIPEHGPGNRNVNFAMIMK